MLKKRKKPVERKFEKILCACDHDIEEHRWDYNERTDEYFSGGCFFKLCKCSKFNLPKEVE